MSYPSTIKELIEENKELRAKLHETDEQRIIRVNTWLKTYGARIGTEGMLQLWKALNFMRQI